MKSLAVVTLLSSILVCNLGCDRGTPGGVGVPPDGTNNKVPVTGPSEGTFSLDVPNFATKIHQGEAKVVTIDVRRGKNFSSAVTLTFSGMPSGLTLDSATIPAGDKEAKVTVKAADNAPLGDHTIHVSGQGGAGPAATNNFTVTVQKK